MNIKGLRLENNKLKIPESKTRLKFDIGLSWCAPNSALWLTEEDDLFVIGIEPNVDALNSIKERGCVWNKNQCIEITEENYMLLECAVDNVSEPIEKTFYSMLGDPGTSSLLKPTIKLINKQKLKNDNRVLCVSLKSIFELIPWDRFECVDLIKTDCQGKDFDVIKSLGKYIEKVAYFNCEYSGNQHYVNENDGKAFYNFFIKNGFHDMGMLGGDIRMSNSRINNSIIKHKCLNL